MPAGGCVREVFSVLVLAESDLWGDAKDASVGSHQNRFDVPAVFRVIDLCELLPNGAVFDFFGSAFEDDGFVRLFGADDNVRAGDDVSCFLRARASAEPESVLPPNAPDDHDVRTAIWTRGGNPIVMRFFETLEGPVPGF